MGYIDYILAKYLDKFCPCFETLHEAEFKDAALVYIAQISRQHNIQAVAWTLLSAFSQI
jgi:hypothetical protein